LDVGIFLDGNPIHTEALDIADGENDCRIKQQQDCSGECELSWNPSGTTYGECGWYEPPPWPPDTIPAGCFCQRKGKKSQTAAYTGEEMVSFELDMIGMVQERYETNNYFALNIGTVAARPSTWGRIKSLFDE
jgi:hypothetical protein